MIWHELTSMIDILYIDMYWQFERLVFTVHIYRYMIFFVICTILVHYFASNEFGFPVQFSNPSPSNGLGAVKAFRQLHLCVGRWWLPHGTLHYVGLGWFRMSGVGAVSAPHSVTWLYMVGRLGASLVCCVLFDVCLKTHSNQHIEQLFLLLAVFAIAVQDDTVFTPLFVL